MSDAKPTPSKPYQHEEDPLDRDVFEDLLTDLAFARDNRGDRAASDERTRVGNQIKAYVYEHYTRRV